MKIIYSPEGEEPQQFEFIPAKLISPEAEAIENVGGASWDTFEEFGQKFLKGSVRAYRAALWIMLKRQNPKLRFQEVEFTLEQVEIDYSKTELNKIKDALELDDGSIPEEQRQAALSQIANQLKDKEFEEMTGDLKEPIENSGDADSSSAQPDSHPEYEK